MTRRVVVDASLLVPLIQKDARSVTVTARFEEWFRTETEIHLPELALFELASALTQLVRAGSCSLEQVRPAWVELQSLPLEYHPLNDAHRVVEIALQLQRKSAYDAAYLALGEALETELWTLDGPLVRNAKPRGFQVNLLET